MPEIKVVVDPGVGQDLTEWAKRVQGCNRSTRRFCSVQLRRLNELRRKGPDALKKMEAKDFIYELELAR